jgi:hypothetical protein
MPRGGAALELSFAPPAHGRWRARWPGAIPSSFALALPRLPSTRPQGTRKRAFKKFSYRGVDLDKLLDLSHQVHPPVAKLLERTRRDPPEMMDAPAVIAYGGRRCSWCSGGSAADPAQHQAIPRT